MEFRSLQRLVVLSILVAAVPAAAQERKLTRSQLPPSVVATVEKETQGATIKGYSTERDHGRVVYEAETVVNGHTRDLQIDKNGALMEIEEEVSMESLPATVSASLKSRAKGGTINKVESLTKAGKLVAYEASTQKAGHKGEIQVGPAGEKLQHEE